MIYLHSFTVIDSEDSVVGGIHFMPFDEVNGFGKTKAELEEDGYLIKDLLINEAKENQVSILHINPKTKDTWYSYEEMPTTPNPLEGE
jgi:hypothetical protein